MTMQIPTPIRRLLRSRSAVRIPQPHEREDEDRQLEDEPHARSVTMTNE